MIPPLMRRPMPTPTNYALDGTVPFTAPCPSCGEQCDWVSTRGKGYSDGSVIDIPSYDLCPKEENR